MFFPRNRTKSAFGKFWKNIWMSFPEIANQVKNVGFYLTLGLKLNKTEIERVFQNKAFSRK